MSFSPIGKSFWRVEPALFLNGSPVRSEAPQKNRILPECRAEDVASDTEAQGRGYMKRVWGVGQEMSGWGLGEDQWQGRGRLHDTEEG